MHSTSATSEGTERFLKRFTDLDKSHYRQFDGLNLSSLGIGTYMGNWDDSTDQKYVDSITRFIELGGNVIDTASNYRFQRSERAIGKVLSNANGFERDEVFISSKAGYLPFDGEPVGDVPAYFESEFVKKGIAKTSDLVGGSHCMSPGYLESQIEQSLENLKLECIDLYYLHNPEAQLTEIDKYTFEARLAKAFEKFEEKREEGKINYYGAATWEGFRIPPDQQKYHSIERFVSVAKQVGGEGHGFRFVQLPHNLAMPEAYVVPNQAVMGKAKPLIEAAGDLGVGVMVSSSLLQGQLSANVPMPLRQSFSGTTDALTSLQFARSTPGVLTALVGMSSSDHVDENLSLANIKSTEKAVYDELFSIE